MSWTRLLWLAVGALVAMGCVLDDPYFIDQSGSLKADDPAFSEADQGSGSSSGPGANPTDDDESASASPPAGADLDAGAPADVPTGDDEETDETAGDDDGPDSAMSDASAPAAVCGDGVRTSGEECDGEDLNDASCASLMSTEFSAGVLSCSDTCEFDTSACEPTAVCGNGVLETGESCDSLQLDGQTCADLGYSGGTLSCSSDCELDETECSSGTGCDATSSGSLGIVYQGNTEDASNSISRHSCTPLGGGRGGDLTLAWTAPDSGCYSISIRSEQDLDTIASVHSSCDLDDELACDNNSGSDQLSAVEFEAVANTSYALVIDSFYESDEGSVTVVVSPCAPEEWTCADEHFGRGDGCDCGCGLLDPDCASATSSSCQVCDLDGSCATQCGEISEESNWECQTGGVFGGGFQGGGPRGG